MAVKIPMNSGGDKKNPRNFRMGMGQLSDN